MLTQMMNRVPVLFKSLLDRKLDATEFLIQDHMKVEKLFMQIQLLNRMYPRLPSRKLELKARREKTFGEIRNELTKHTQAEETVFYPECEKHDETRPMIKEALEEHRQVKVLLDEMMDLSINHETFAAKLTVLMENVRHHVREEEEKLLPKVRKVMTSMKLERLAGQMRMKKSKRRKTAAAA